VGANGGANNGFGSAWMGVDVLEVAALVRKCGRIALDVPIWLPIRC
jgi:hypothetical protein